MKNADFRNDASDFQTENRSRNGAIPLRGGAEMNDNEIHAAIQSDFLKNVSDVLLRAQKNTKTAVNLSMVYAYFEIGRMIVEEEQHGENRAAYGKQLLKELSAYLTSRFGKGYSAENLKLMRRFYSIDADRAVNYKCDEEGTALNYEVISAAVCSVRAAQPLSADWKRRIDEDVKKRGR